MKTQSLKRQQAYADLPQVVSAASTGSKDGVRRDRIENPSRVRNSFNAPGQPATSDIASTMKSQSPKRPQAYADLSRVISAASSSASKKYRYASSNKSIF
ncbi:hypothetical protein CDAR_438011 [Caerostris darwini]|uniref:Uncharacterized protein n=1 Tax=Caerostris darwini TaxID=1538125 RepID=A0AAV4TVU6_9ARAC|nr:hypothetical protein CDAR_438011 [Caerostris darwini]